MIVFYTALLGNPGDTLRPAPKLPGTRFVAITDRPMSGTNWELRADPPHPDPRRRARWWKTHSFDVSPDADYTVWMDATMQCRNLSTQQLDELVSAVDDQTPIASFKHHSRCCWLQEAQECIRLNKDSEAILRTQLNAYLARQVPLFAGLAETGVVVRKNCSAALEFNNAWWGELQRYSCRDQVSFPYVSWSSGIPWRKLPGTCYRNSWFDFYRHNS